MRTSTPEHGEKHTKARQMDAEACGKHAKERQKHAKSTPKAVVILCPAAKQWPLPRGT